MPVDPLLSGYSDLLFRAALVIYVLAMVFHAVEYVSARALEKVAPEKVAPAKVAPAKAEAAEPVVAAVGGTGTADLGIVSAENADVPAPTATEAKARPGRSRSDRFGRMAVSVSILAVVLHLGSIVLRGLAAGRWPLGNMYEYTSALCLAAMVAWLVVLRRTTKGSLALRKLGVFVLVPVLILMFLAGTVLYAQAAPVVPALRSYWLVIHVTSVTAASGLLVVPGVASILYLMKRSGKPAGFVAKLPAADALDRMAYRVTIVAFPMYTFAVIVGAIWAEAAWGRFWGWDPKETVAFVAWVVYAAYLHSRATAGWRGKASAWINVVGCAAVIFNLFFINMVVAGLHSYAGLG